MFFHDDLMHINPGSTSSRDIALEDGFHGSHGSREKNGDPNRGVFFVHPKLTSQRHIQHLNQNYRYQQIVHGIPIGPIGRLCQPHHHYLEVSSNWGYIPPVTIHY